MTIIGGGVVVCEGIGRVFAGVAMQAGGGLLAACL
jgi:hypothetical protein